MNVNRVCLEVGWGPHFQVDRVCLFFPHQCSNDSFHSSTNELYERTWVCFNWSKQVRDEHYYWLMHSILWYTWKMTHSCSFFLCSSQDSACGCVCVSVCENIWCGKDGVCLYDGNFLLVLYSGHWFAYFIVHLLLNQLNCFNQIILNHLSFPPALKQYLYPWIVAKVVPLWDSDATQQNTNLFEGC